MSVLESVRALGNVDTLNLRGCFGIRDVSALGNVHTLDLSRCFLICDVSALGNCFLLWNILNLFDCSKITDASAF